MNGSRGSSQGKSSMIHTDNIGSPIQPMEQGLHFYRWSQLSHTPVLYFCKGSRRGNRGAKGEKREVGLPGTPGEPGMYMQPRVQVLLHWTCLLAISALNYNKLYAWVSSDICLQQTTINWDFFSLLRWCSSRRLCGESFPLSSLRNIYWFNSQILYK